MVKPIRVLHVIDKFTMDGVNPSSCSRLFAEWIPLHDRTKFEVDVAGLRPRDAAGKWLESFGIKTYYITEGKYSFKNVSAIAEIAKNGNYDILHLHGYSSANFGRMASKKCGAKNIVHEHAVLKVLPHQFVIDFLLRNKTDVGLGVSKAVKEFMMKGRSIPENKIEVIWNGITLKSFQNIDLEKSNSFKKAHNIPENTTVIGSVTRLREEKGNAHLIEAMAKVVKEEPNTCLVLIGDGPLKEQLAQQAQSLDIADKVIFTGFVSDVTTALGALDVVAIPSLREGFGLALVEAMAAGKPVVASFVGGMKELAENGKTAVMVPPADAGRLANGLIKILKESDFRAKISKNAKEASEQFSIERNVTALEALYSRIMGR